MTYRRWGEATLGAIAGAMGGTVAAFMLEAQGNLDSMAPLALGVAAMDMAAGSLGTITFAALSALVGAVYGLSYRFQPGRPVATLAAGLLFGLLWWALLWLTLVPILAGTEPTWSVQQSAATFPQLVASVFFGGLMAIAFHALCHVIVGGRADTEQVVVAAAHPTRRVVIVGGGFGGVAAAERLEERLTHRPDVSVTLVSQDNYLLFTPMLAEVASGTLIPRHVAVALRALCPRTTIRSALAEGVDTTARRVSIRPLTGGSSESLPYDELILATGAVPAFHGLPGLERHALTLKSLEDAADIHDHVLGALDRAESETDAEERRRLLTFVVAGGGFAGVEMIAELRDLIRGALIHHPHIDPAELRFILVHSRPRILPELSESLGDYARERLERRAIEFRLGVRLSGADADGVTLSDGSSIPTATLIWTAGNRPSSLPGTLATTDAGAVVATDETLRVQGLEHVWAIGDCARIPDPDRPGESCPPTAQHALRQGKRAADNVVAALDGREPRPFTFRTLGTLVVLGHNTAAAEIRGRRFSGLLAWFMWRGIYLSKLPGFERKVRVLFDWVLDLVFPRDIVIVRAGPATTGPTVETTDETAASDRVESTQGDLARSWKGSGR